MKKYSALLTIGLLWLLATAVNLNKAVHIDDTFHLKAAQWIFDNPLRPMSACINWGDDIQDMYCSSQPALYFYLLAITGSISNWSLTALHLMQSLFTLIALYFFYATARTLAPRHAIWLTLILGTNAAFLVNQNLMVDMPILAMGMMVLYFSLKPEPGPGAYASANLAIGLGFLMKYTSIAFAPVIALSILLRKKWWMVLWAAIPGILFLLWSGLNYSEYRRIHLINRVPEPFDAEMLWQKVLAFVMVMGSITPFVIAFLFRFLNLSNRTSAIVLTSIVALIIIYVSAFYTGYIPAFRSDTFLVDVFVFSGTLFVLSTFWVMGVRLQKGWSEGDQVDRLPIILLLTGLLSVSVFVIWFAPFMATRHVLLVLPFLLLLWAYELDTLPTPALWTGFALNAVLGIILSVEDVRFSRDYERYAHIAAQLLPDKQNSYVLGHWGFQWYMEEKGYPVYETSFTKVKTGDYFLIPRNFSVQNVAENIELSDPVHWISDPGSILNVRNFASLYASPFPFPVWRLNRDYQDTLSLYKVMRVKD